MASSDNEDRSDKHSKTQAPMVQLCFPLIGALRRRLQLPRSLQWHALGFLDVLGLAAVAETERGGWASVRGYYEQATELDLSRHADHHPLATVLERCRRLRVLCLAAADRVALEQLATVIGNNQGHFRGCQPVRGLSQDSLVPMDKLVGALEACPFLDRLLLCPPEYLAKATHQRLQQLAQQRLAAGTLRGLALPFAPDDKALQLIESSRLEALEWSVYTPLDLGARLLRPGFAALREFGCCVGASVKDVHAFLGQLGLALETLASLTRLSVVVTTRPARLSLPPLSLPWRLPVLRAFKWSALTRSGASLCCMPQVDAPALTTWETNTPCGCGCCAPITLATFPLLELLRFRGGCLDRLCPPLEKVPALRELDVAGCTLFTAGFALIARCKRLERLHLHCQSLHPDDAWTTLCALPRLEVADCRATLGRFDAKQSVLKPVLKPVAPPPELARCRLLRIDALPGARLGLSKGPRLPSLQQLELRYDAANLGHLLQAAPALRSLVLDTQRPRSRWRDRLFLPSDLRLAALEHLVLQQLPMAVVAHLGRALGGSLRELAICHEPGYWTDAALDGSTLPGLFPRLRMLRWRSDKLGAHAKLPGSHAKLLEEWARNAPAHLRRIELAAPSAVDVAIAELVRDIDQAAGRPLATVVRMDAPL